MSLKYFKTALPLQSAFMAGPLFLLQELQIPSRIGALLDCQGGDDDSSAHA
jgi:hypothetical protein